MRQEVRDQPPRYPLPGVPGQVMSQLVPHDGGQLVLVPRVSEQAREHEHVIARQHERVRRLAPDHRVGPRLFSRHLIARGKMAVRETPPGLGDPTPHPPHRNGSAMIGGKNVGPELTEELGVLPVAHGALPLGRRGEDAQPACEGDLVEALIVAVTEGSSDGEDGGVNIGRDAGRRAGWGVTSRSKAAVMPGATIHASGFRLVYGCVCYAVWSCRLCDNYAYLKTYSLLSRLEPY